GPLSLYMPRIPWAGPGGSNSGASSPRTVSEIDVIGNAPEAAPAPPPGVRLISAHVVDGYQVDRFALRTPATLDAASAGTSASRLLPAGGSPPAVIFQRGSA
ncbi:MAG: hypothetical protein ACRDMJ_02080, partial [Solirubrobacteraceae bacterium]